MDGAGKSYSLSIDGIPVKICCTGDPNNSQNAKCLACPVTVKMRLADCLIFVKGLLLLISISILKPTKRQWKGWEMIEEPVPRKLFMLWLVSSSLTYDGSHGQWSAKSEI